MAFERFGKDRHQPPGEWVQTTTVEEIVGIQYRRDQVDAFCAAVRAAERAGLPYGVKLLPDPTNKHDPCAIQVHGYADVSDFWRSGTKTWHVGFLRRELARELHEDLLGQGLAIDAELYEIYPGGDGFTEIKIIVLAPPGNSMSARHRRTG